ncbi:MAG: rod shape-determining protein MreC [Novosphingobium sp.]
MAPPTIRRSGHSRRAQYTTFAGYLLAFGGMLVAGVLLVISTRNPEAFSGARSAASDAVAPAGEGSAQARANSRGFWEALSGFFTSGRDTARLKREVAEARSRLAAADALAEENRRLKSALGLFESDPKPVVAARLVASTSASTRRYATLGAGSRQGVAVGMPVRSSVGLVGRVLEVGAVSARVLLITDLESFVPVRRATDGIDATAEGQSDGTLRLRLSSLGINPLKRGDAFVTSGSGGLYRPGIPIAVVVRLLPDGAIARPLSDPGATDLVVVDPVWAPVATQPASSPMPGDG